MLLSHQEISFFNQRIRLIFYLFQNWQQICWIVVHIQSFHYLEYSFEESSLQLNCGLGLRIAQTFKRRRKARISLFWSLLVFLSSLTRSRTLASASFIHLGWPRGSGRLIFMHDLFLLRMWRRPTLTLLPEESQLGLQLFLSFLHGYIISLNTFNLRDHRIHFLLYLTFLCICRVLVILYQTNLKQILIFKPMDMLKQRFLVEINVEIVVFVLITYSNFLRLLLRFLRCTFGRWCFDFFILRLVICIYKTLLIWLFQNALVTLFLDTSQKSCFSLAFLYWSSLDLCLLPWSIWFLICLNGQNI